MCRMTDTGARWRRDIAPPDFGDSETWWAVRYNDETRYTRKPPVWSEDEIRKLMTPLYAITVRARAV